MTLALADLAKWPFGLVLVALVAFVGIGSSAVSWLVASDNQSERSNELRKRKHFSALGIVTGVGLFCFAAELAAGAVGAFAGYFPINQYADPTSPWQYLVVVFYTFCVVAVGPTWITAGRLIDKTHLVGQMRWAVLGTCLILVSFAWVVPSIMVAAS